MGSALTAEDISGPKESIKGTVLVRDEGSTEDYDASIKRWNEVYIKRAVSLF